MSLTIEGRHVWPTQPAVWVSTADSRQSAGLGYQRPMFKSHYAMKLAG